MKNNNISDCILIFPKIEYENLVKHLLPNHIRTEECAFLFFDINVTSNTTEFIYSDKYFLKEQDFVHRSEYHFEVKDEIRLHVIKKAHNSGLILAEAHSHIGQRIAEFSSTDWSGFSEFVPHVRWRLKGIPYLALVFTESGFDGLVWKHEKPNMISCLVAGNNRIIPSNKSIQYLAWKENMTVKSNFLDHRNKKF